MAPTFLKPWPRPGDGAWLLQDGEGRKRNRRQRRKIQSSFLLQSQDDDCKAGEEAEVESESESSLLRIGKERTSHATYSSKHEPQTMATSKPLSPTMRISPQPLPPVSRGSLTTHDLANTNEASERSVPSPSIASPDKMAIPPHLRPRKVHSTSQTSKETPPGDGATPKDTSISGVVSPNDSFIDDRMPRKGQPKHKVKNDSAELKDTQNFAHDIKPSKTSDEATADNTATTSWIEPSNTFIQNDIPHQGAAKISSTSPVAEFKDKKPTNGVVLPTADTTQVDIREKLKHDHGVNVSDPKSAQKSSRSLVPYPSSNEGSESDTNIIVSKPARDISRTGPKATPWNEDQPKNNNTERQPSRRGGRNASRGRGNGAFARGTPPARESRWPKNKDMAPDPRQHDIKWDENSRDSIDSARADSGWGGKTKKRKDIDSETGFKLTGYDGDWAPAPIEWDARPAFRDNQSAAKIEDWMEVTEKAMVNIDWAVPIDELTMGEEDPGEVAPRYWIPLAIEKQTPQAFWDALITVKKPIPIDEGDMNDAVPWWQLYGTSKSNMIKARDHAEMKGIDPDEKLDERLARENDFGSSEHAENRKRFEKAKRDAEREKRKRAAEKSRKISKALLGECRESIKPDIKLYLRSARPTDIKAIRDIYNHYVCYSVCTPEIERRTLADMEQRYNDIIGNQFPFLVACERGAVIKPRRKKYEGESIILPDTILGFAIADDYNDMLGMYRFTAEVELFVHKDYYLKGVAKCLLDKMMAMLDPEYIERGGYDIEGDELEGVGQSRIIQNVIINLPYETEKPMRLEWIGKWLKNWIGFTQVADLPKVGLKDKKNVSLAIFHRTTGVNIDPASPPFTTGYPK